MQACTSLAALAIGAFLSAAATSEASDAPKPPVTAPGQSFVVSLLFVQSAASGTFTANAEKPGTYRLRLTDVAPDLIYFSDRPQRFAGRVSLHVFLEQIGIGQKDGPNAAVQVTQGKSDADVIVVELVGQSYDPATRSLTYEVKLVDRVVNSLLGWGALRDTRLQAAFSEVMLFIDTMSVPSASFFPFPQFPTPQCETPPPQPPCTPTQPMVPAQCPTPEPCT